MSVLVPMDGSEQSWSALEHAVERFDEATVLVLRVVDPVQAGYGVGSGATAVADDWLESQHEAAEAMFEDVRELAEQAGATVETHTAVGRPARTIEEFAEEQGLDHVVVGSHGRDGVARVLLGSVSEKVVRRSPVPVTVVR
jgi:nucleotide-binding universal stress UspA family protein